MRARWLIAAAILAIAAAGGCGGSDGTGPGTAELTTVEVTPAAPRLFTTAPQHDVTLTVTPRDQGGHAMTGLGAPVFASEDESVATVAGDGTVTAVAEGATRITASVTSGSVTKTGTADVTVAAPAATATVTAPAVQYLPDTVDISVGGSVTWTFEALFHDVIFSTAGAPPDIAVLQDGSDSRTFPTSGVFPYVCSFHQGMRGTVRVH